MSGTPFLRKRALSVDLTVEVIEAAGVVLPQQMLGILGDPGGDAADELFDLGFTERPLFVEELVEAEGAECVGGQVEVGG